MSAREYADQLHHHGDLRSFTDYALRTRAPDAFDVLAYGVSGGRRNFRELIADLDGGRNADRSWTLELARLVALSPEPSERLDTARKLVESVVASTDVSELPEESRILYGQLLVKTRRFDGAEEVRSRLGLPGVHAWAYDIDLVNPYSGSGRSHEAWTGKLNSLFAKGRLEAVTVGDGGSTRFTGLEAADVARVNGPLVSVIMPAHNPDEALITSVRSILDQSWSDVELIIVDDASAEHGRHWIREAAALDPRVCVAELPVNAGTYAARNAGLESARGAFITFQDTDDWSHPRRIELQTRELLEHPDALATRSWAVRAYPDLTFTYVGYPANRPNASSLLYRREKVHDLIGRFDSARKSGDVEFTARLRAAAPGSIRTLDESLTLAITQLRSDSLSRADAVPGWTRWNRIAYRDAYTEWHRHVRAGTADPRAISSGPRPFPLPERSWASDRSAMEANDSYDLLLVGDWRTGQGPQPDAIRDIVASRRLGLRVAIANVEAPVPLATRREVIRSDIQALINDGTIDFRHLEEPLRVGTVLIANHASFRFETGFTVAAEAERILVAVASGPGEMFDVEPGTCMSNIAASFGRVPEWAARDRLALETLRRADADHVADEVLPYAVTRPRWVRAGRAPGRPVIGRPANGHASLWPSTDEELRSAYPVDDEFDVRLLGDVRTALRVMRTKTVPANWTIFDAASLPWRAYLTGLDFFVYFPRRSAQSDAHASILDALAAGCVVILPARHHAVYGDAAVYCEANDVTATLRKLAGVRRAYLRQRERALEFASAYPSFEDVALSWFQTSTCAAREPRRSATR